MADNSKPRFTPIDIETFEGVRPPNHDLCITEDGDPATALTLYGFDEVGLFDHQFKKPVYGFYRMN